MVLINNLPFETKNKKKIFEFAEEIYFSLSDIFENVNIRLLMNNENNKALIYKRLDFNDQTFEIQLLFSPEYFDIIDESLNPFKDLIIEDLLKSIESFYQEID